MVTDATGCTASERIGVLYESDEWSDHKLASELERALAASAPGRAEVRMIDMEQPDCIGKALACDLLVSRVFASARFRGHDASLQHMAELIDAIEPTSIRLINPPQAHFFEIDKQAATQALGAVGLAVPRILSCTTAASLDPSSLEYPCIVKPNCGGRTTFTTIADTAAQLRSWLLRIPADTMLLTEEYIRPERGFLTRIEIVAGVPRLIVKRSIAANGLSAYHLGSTYQPYDDAPPSLLEEATMAACTMGFIFGSFDVIETARGSFFIDANSVSNVSEDCTALFGYDMMRDYAQAIARMAP